MLRKTSFGYVSQQTQVRDTEVVELKHAGNVQTHSLREAERGRDCTKDAARNHCGWKAKGFLSHFLQIGTINQGSPFYKLDLITLIVLCLVWFQPSHFLHPIFYKPSWRRTQSLRVEMQQVPPACSSVFWGGFFRFFFKPSAPWCSLAHPTPPPPHLFLCFASGSPGEGESRLARRGWNAAACRLAPAPLTEFLINDEAQI